MQILTPRPLDWPLASNTEFISCGPVHTLFLVAGKVYSSGSNDFGQLGHEQTRKRPRMSTFCMWKLYHFCKHFITFHISFIPYGQFISILTDLTVYSICNESFESILWSMFWNLEKTCNYLPDLWSFWPQICH